ncbi:hypothetical protein [Acidimangrovimonas sediminis]|uniref:hypothetical protein n=1 Tax=Acidimangrovimonas sediminis TaxID=2056283 RepID=UPI000C808E0C|nr:hypothetical protein [Acidimangrovimonas sediminis]
MARATALSRYQRLESQGIWREAPDAQRRDVIVAFGEASLVLSDVRSEQALTHWSLPAVVRLNPGEVPALYSPSEDGVETLELDDDEMISAIETVRGAIEARMPRPGRLRHVITGTALTAVVLLAVFWLPGALIDHTAQVVPQSKRQDIGRMVLADLTRITGPACSDPDGKRALTLLTDRLFPDGGAQVIVVPGGPARAVHLPGGYVVLRRDLIERYEGPDVAAGYMLAERARAAQTDPLKSLLRWAGAAATVRLLTTGQMSTGAVHGYAEVLLKRAAQPAEVSETALIARFRAEELSPAPYARALDAATPPEPGAAATAAGLLAADPFKSDPPPPLIPDDSWVGLQGICQNS